MNSTLSSLLRQGLTSALFVVLFSLGSFAQSTTDGAIGGTVFDPQGATVDNARVSIRNNGTNIEETTSTNSTGFYRVQHLQPGVYTVAITSQGFAAFTSEQVIVQVGSLTQIDAHLNINSAAATVDVSAEAPQINYTSPEIAGTLNQTAIANLPINGGRWSIFALQTPGAVSDSSNFGSISFRGISPLLNNYTFDGADNNQAFFADERGRNRIGYSTPKEAVEEFQVNTSNYSAEYGRSAGGVVNTVSKSGTNEIHGEGYFYDRDSVWSAFNEFSQINVPTSSGTFVSQPYKPTDIRKMTGFGVGGPLIKDKLFWFLAYDYYTRNFPGVAVTSNPNVFFATPSASTISTLATRLGVTPAQATTIYNNDLAGLNTMLGPVPRTGKQNILFPKIDWQIDQKNHASFSFNRMRWSSPAGIQTQPTVTRGIASFGNDFVKETWGVAKLDTAFTSSISNELRFQYGRDFEFQFSQAPTQYELANLVNPPGYANPLGLPPSVSITNGFTFGVPNFLQRSRFPDESRMQIADTLTWLHGNHSFKFGADVSHVDDNSQNLFNGYGSYSYSSLLNYFSDLNKPNTCAGKPCYTSFSQGTGLPGLEFNTNDTAIFVEDNWKILSHLNITIGMRYEYEQLPSPQLANSVVPQTNAFRADTSNFGPRAGFAWDIFGGGKTVLRGGAGIYYGRVINSTIFNALINTGIVGRSQLSYSFTPTSTGAPVFPQILAAPSGTIKPNVVFFDGRFQDPQVDEMDLTLERDLGWGTVVSASYMGSLGRELPDFVDTNLCIGANQAGFGSAPGCPAPGTITYNVVGGGPLTGGTYTTQLFKPFGATQPRPNANFGAMTDVFSGVNSSYHAFVIQANHRMSHHVQFGASYTWAHAIDFGQNETTFSSTNALLFPNNINPEKGNSQFDVRNRFVMNAVITSPWNEKGWMGWLANGWAIDPIYQIQKGLPYTLSVAGNAPGGASVVAVSGINGSGGTNRVDVLGYDSFRMPHTWLLDLRASKTFTFREKYGLEFSADFFNIANKQNVTSVNTNGYGISGSNLTFNPTFGTVTSTNNSGGFQPRPREIQLGARIKF